MFAISVSLYRIRSSFTHIQGELRRCGVCRNVHRDCHKSAVGCENEVRTNIHIWYHRLILCVCVLLLKTPKKHSTSSLSHTQMALPVAAVPMKDVIDLMYVAIVVFVVVVVDITCLYMRRCYRMQTSFSLIGSAKNGGGGGGRIYKSTFDAIRTIAKKEGISGMYSGLGPSLIGCLHVVIQFPLYERLKNYAAETADKPPNVLGTSELFFAASVSKMVRANLCVCVFPCMESSRSITSLYVCLSVMYRLNEEHTACTDRLDHHHQHFTDVYLWSIGVSVCVCVCVHAYRYVTHNTTQIASTCTYPHEVIRTKMQISGSGPFKGFWKTFRTVVKRYE